MGHLGSIDHFVVLMLENRSFDNLLGASGAFLTCNMPKPAMRTRSPFYPALFVAHTHTHTHTHARGMSGAIAGGGGEFSLAR